MRTLILLLSVFLLSSPVLAQNQITMTTYYPAPTGQYNSLRLNPQTWTDPTVSGIPCNATLRGSVSTNVNGQIYICVWTGTAHVWSPGGPWISDTSVTPNLLYPAVLNTNVGIGVAAPTSTLQVDGSFTVNTATSPSSFPFRINETWNNSSVFFQGLFLNVTDTNSGAGSRLLDIARNGPSVLFVDKAGNVGIGPLASTNAVLNVYGNPNVASSQIMVQGTNGNPDTGIAFQDPPSTNGINNWITVFNISKRMRFFSIANTGGFEFHVSPGSESLTITSAGNVGIGDNTPSFKLDVGGEINVSNTGTNAGCPTGGCVHALAYLSDSDERLKKNIRPITDALNKVSQLNGVTYAWKDTGASDIGVVAQNVEKVFPELVATNKDGIKSVKYDHLTAVLIEAIKEQQKEINELKEQLQLLKK